MQQDFFNTETLSYSVQFQNYTANPIVIADGSKTRPRILPPLLNDIGTFRPNMPQGAAGKVIAIRSDCVEAPMQVGFASKHDNAFWDTVAVPPALPGPELQQWVHVSKEFNIALSGSKQALETFLKQYGTVYDYLKQTEFSTRFINNLNYGIMNVTGKPLYQVDDTGCDDIGYADVITIPCGSDLPIPLWDQQIANNRFNVDTSRPFIRAFRYELMSTNENHYVGTMRERIYYWDSEMLTEDGFLYMPQFHICLFDKYSDAEAFIKKYRTVENWEKLKIEHDMYAAINQHAKTLETNINTRNKTILKGCAILVSVQVAWKLGELIVWLVKENANKSGRSSPASKKSFMDLGNTSSFGNIDVLGSILLS